MSIALPTTKLPLLTQDEFEAQVLVGARLGLLVEGQSFWRVRLKDRRPRPLGFYYCEEFGEFYERFRKIDSNRDLDIWLEPRERAGRGEFLAKFTYNPPF